MNNKNELSSLLAVLALGLIVALFFYFTVTIDAEVAIQAEPTKATVPLDWNPVDPRRPGLTCLESELDLSNGYSLYLTYCGPAE